MQRIWMAGGNAYGLPDGRIMGMVGGTDCGDGWRDRLCEWLVGQIMWMSGGQIMWMVGGTDYGDG